jgi:hypothetical protein
LLAPLFRAVGQQIIKKLRRPLTIEAELTEVPKLGTKRLGGEFLPAIARLVERTRYDLEFGQNGRPVEENQFAPTFHCVVAITELGCPASNRTHGRAQGRHDCRKNLSADMAPIDDRGDGHARSRLDTLLGSIREVGTSPLSGIILSDSISAAVATSREGDRRAYTLS